LGTVTAGHPALRVDVTAVSRITRDVVEVRLRVTNPDPVHPVELGSRCAESDGDGEEGTFSGAYLVAEDGSARYFVLRDPQGRPACSVDPTPLGPGVERAASMRFPSPGRSAARITLQMKGMPSLTGLPLAEAP
jgi:hypothetical protein